MFRLAPRYLVRVFLAAPILISALISILTIQYTKSSIVVPIFLIFSALSISFLEILYNEYRPRDHHEIVLNKTEEIVILGFGLAVICFCLADLYSHGLTLIDSNRYAYATFTPFQHHLRHFSSLIWLLAILGFFVKNKYIKALFLISSFTFPVLFLDRNRMLMSAFSLVVMIALGFLPTRKKVNKTFVVGFVVTAIAILFAYLGQVRSDNNNILSVLGKSRQEHMAIIYNPVPDILLKNCVLPDKIPFKVDVNSVNPLVLWIGLYVSVPVYNLATQYDCEARTPVVLKEQMIPAYKGRTNINAILPLANPALNVATEFLPFFLVGGLALSFIILLLAAGSILLVSTYAHVTKNIFVLIFLIRLLYCAAFFNFAPQFFIWTTLGLACILVSLKIATGFFEKKRAKV